MGPSSGAAFVQTQTSPLPSRCAVSARLAQQAEHAHQQEQQRAVVALTPRDDEPNLFNIPSIISPIYRPVPLWLNFVIGTASLAVVGRNIISSLIQSLQLEWTTKKIISLLLRYVVLWSVARIVVQEGFYCPSRVTSQYLADTGSLPSILSSYETITPISVGGSQSIPIGVHYLKYTSKTSTNKKYAAIQFHHGFGASSLSWLPILPSLTDRLSDVSVAHDAPGFGFTARPNADTVEGLAQYRSNNSVGIGLALLQNSINKNSGERQGENDMKEIVIFGHSMGAKAALLTALACSSDKKLKMHPGLVVLVAPALEGITLPTRSRKKPMAELPNKLNGVRRWLASFWISWRKLFLDWPFQYLLRRLVGTRNFWRKGLSQAWGDAQRLSDSDVLRFQWPSIGKGWERGLISFARSIQSSDDADLLRQVANLANTTVLVVYGSKDNVVRVNEKVLDLLKNDFRMVKVLRMEGLGHDPFEEDKDMFLDMITS